MKKDEILRETRSVCPVCLKKIPALIERIEGRTGIWMKKTCLDHGSFETLVWKDRFDIDEWTSGEKLLSCEESDHCSMNCKSCISHLQD